MSGLGRIPKASVVLQHRGLQIVVSAGVDTGNEGLASITPNLAQRLGLPTVGNTYIMTAAGNTPVPIMQIDSLGIDGSPNCVAKNAQVLVHDFPGSDQVLLGERFFEQFVFNIDYQSGYPQVVCGVRQAPSWVMPVAALAGLAVIAVGGYFLVRD